MEYVDIDDIVNIRISWKSRCEWQVFFLQKVN